MEPATVSQLKAHVREMIVHPAHFAYPDAPFDEEPMTEFHLMEIADPDLLGFLSVNDGHQMTSSERFHLATGP